MSAHVALKAHVTQSWQPYNVPRIPNFTKEKSTLWLIPRAKVIYQASNGKKKLHLEASGKQSPKVVSAMRL